ncbi:hypothetical protein FA13DRAFT_1696528 [Coprinellus micaceus]|uniref:Uncharacterized protein n=1 Tax=Coprinellus micaceus TaxID=71717 RepID=A0A4Y7SG49_COPMI|nr:hypothetical protein FA13DRAFT_1696528 [Coprinellus micaceus]
MNPSISEMQTRLTWSEAEYCGRRAFLEISALKSVCCLIGAAKLPEENLTVSNGSQIIDYVDEFRYTGIHFSSNIQDPFLPHYTAWAAKARTAVHTVFSTETFVRSIPVPTGVKLSFALVDPYLIYGCDVVIDVNEKCLRMYEATQHYYMRRLLGLQPRSPVGALHVLTSIPPIRHRHVELELRYARYAIVQPENHYENRAYRDAIAMYRRKQHSWITDLEKAMRKLPRHPVRLDVGLMESEEGMDSLREQVRISCARYLYDELESNRTPLLNPKYLPISRDSYQSALVLRKFLRTIRIPAHRVSVVRLLCADHTLAVEQLRRRRNSDGSRIEVECRSCRYGDANTETEVHALFRCEGPGDGILVKKRSAFMDQVFEVAGRRLVERCTENGNDDGPIMAVHFFLEHDDLAPIFGKYVYDVLKMFPISAM